MSSAYSVYATQKNAKKQESAQRQAAQVREEEIFAQKSHEANTRLNQAKAERSRLRAMSAESGVAGLSITDLLDNVDMQAGMDMATIDANHGLAQRANTAETQSRLNSIQQPDYISAGLQIGLAGAQFYENRKDRT